MTSAASAQASDAPEPPNDLTAIGALHTGHKASSPGCNAGISTIESQRSQPIVRTSLSFAESLSKIVSHTFL